MPVHWSLLACNGRRVEFEIYFQFQKWFSLQLKRTTMRKPISVIIFGSGLTLKFLLNSSLHERWARPTGAIDMMNELITRNESGKKKSGYQATDRAPTQKFITVFKKQARFSWVSHASWFNNRLTVKRRNRPRILFIILPFSDII